MFDSKQVERDAIAAFLQRKRVTIAANSVVKITTSKSSAGIAEVAVEVAAKRFFRETNDDFNERVMSERAYVRKAHESKEF